MPTIDDWGRITYRSMRRTDDAETTLCNGTVLKQCGPVDTKDKSNIHIVYRDRPILVFSEVGSVRMFTYGERDGDLHRRLTTFSGVAIARDGRVWYYNSTRVDHQTGDIVTKRFPFKDGVLLYPGSPEDHLRSLSASVVFK